MVNKGSDKEGEAWGKERGEVMLKKGDGDGRLVLKGVQLTNYQRVD